MTRLILKELLHHRNNFSSNIWIFSDIMSHRNPGVSRGSTCGPMFTRLHLYKLSLSQNFSIPAPENIPTEVDWFSVFHPTFTAEASKRSRFSFTNWAKINSKILCVSATVFAVELSFCFYITAQLAFPRSQTSCRSGWKSQRSRIVYLDLDSHYRSFQMTPVAFPSHLRESVELLTSHRL